jgi:hypothetical protein
MQIRSLIVLAAFVLSGRACLSDPIPATYLVEATTPDIGKVLTQTGTSTVSLIYSSTATASLPFSAVTATAGPNHLGVYAGVGATAGVAAGASEDAQVWAYSTDHLLLQNAPQNGYLSLLVSVLGSTLIESNGTGYGQADVQFRASTSAGSACEWNGVNGAGCGPYIPGLALLQVPYALASDDTTIFGEELMSYNYCDVSDGSTGGNCSSQSFFFDTAQIASITVEDANGHVVPGATVTSLAGVNYSLPQTVTPEPSSLVLFGSGLLGFAILSRRIAAA